MNSKNQYEFRTSKAETDQLVKQIMNLEHKEDISRKLTGTHGKNGNFVFTLRRLASGGLPSYSPQLIGKVTGDKRNSVIQFRFRSSIMIFTFGILMSIIISVLFYKHFIIQAGDGKSLMFAVLSIVILLATILVHFGLKRELKSHFLDLILDEDSKQLNNIY
ncbi:MAG: hypothetical protein GQ574_09155 [Crocinitomix sp.]|nr:hypothetical protein [Crocinitomix sp.]